MSMELKIKACSLAAEARLIRENERRLCRRILKRRNKQKSYSRDNAARESLYFHRTGPVRREARLTHIARGFLNGLPYGDVERPVRKRLFDDDLKRISQLVTKYGEHECSVEAVEMWMNIE